MFNSRKLQMRNKNVVVRRRRRAIIQDKDKASNKKIPTNSIVAVADCETVDNIMVTTDDDDDKDSIVLSVEMVADCFKEGLIEYDFGQIFVHFNLPSNFLTNIENTVRDEQKGFQSVHDVYTSYKHFLMYRNKAGKIMTLPKNQQFYKVFQRLDREVSETGRLKPFVSVMLKDVYNTKQNSGRERQHEGRSKECNEAKSNLDECDVSLNMSKRKTAISNKKTIHKHLRSALPQITSPIPRQNIFFASPVDGDLQYPVQVSEEQRDSELSHSQQVLSNEQSYVSRDSFTYGFSSQAHTNDPVISHAPSPEESARRRQGRPRVQPRYPNYTNYADRLISFSTWTHRSPNPERLSQAGFFFTKNGDLVRCFQCGIGLKDFSSEDDPLLDHVRHSQQCPFLPELLGEEGLAMYQRHLQNIDPDYDRRLQWRTRQNGSFTRSSYRHPEYQTLEARLSTYTNWPSQMMQRPEQLAEAGLYYTGFEDHVRCFACDGGLRRWDTEDDPWTEHCRWFPVCPYAIEQKGEEYIALVQASSENDGYEASGGAGDLPGALERLKLRESEIESIIAKHRDVCLEMGYKEESLKEAVKELRERGNDSPSLEDIIVLIDVIRERKITSGLLISKNKESPMEENHRLKSIVFCMICGKNQINALFLPCTHHKLCISCAEPLDNCPVCQREIREKIRTYMV